MLRNNATSTAMREAARVFKKVETKNTMTEYATEQSAHHANRERLKAERLAREAKLRRK
jgi:hypothetical protein